MLFFLIGLALAGASVYLVAKAVSMPRVRAAETIAKIDLYGYSRAADDVEESSAMRGALDDIAGAVGSVVAGRFGGKHEQDVRSHLMAAGLYGMTSRRFIGYQTLAAITFPAAWIWFTGTTGMAGFFVLPGAVLAVYLGWRAPLIIVDRRARFRLQEIDYELPELVDLLVVTVEAGLGFSGSLQVASERIDGPLGEELRLTLQEQNMGLTTEEALRNMLIRADTPAVRSFVRAVTQGETLGVSIGDILRSLATEMRKRRRASAEERVLLADEPDARQVELAPEASSLAREALARDREGALREVNESARLLVAERRAAPAQAVYDSARELAPGASAPPGDLGPNLVELPAHDPLALLDPGAEAVTEAPPELPPPSDTPARRQSQDAPRRGHRPGEPPVARRGKLLGLALAHPAAVPQHALGDLEDRHVAVAVARDLGRRGVGGDRRRAYRGCAE